MPEMSNTVLFYLGYSVVGNNCNGWCCLGDRVGY